MEEERKRTIGRCAECGWSIYSDLPESAKRQLEGHMELFHGENYSLYMIDRGFPIYVGYIPDDDEKPEIPDTPITKVTDENEFDPVDHPQHYASGSLECIDWIEAELTSEEFEGYLKGQVFKYVWRYRDKGKKSQDLKKARWYLDKLIDKMEVEEAEEEQAMKRIDSVSAIMDAYKAHIKSRKGVQ